MIFTLNTHIEMSFTKVNAMHTKYFAKNVYNLGDYIITLSKKYVFCQLVWKKN